MQYTEEFLESQFNLIFREVVYGIERYYAGDRIVSKFELEQATFPEVQSWMTCSGLLQNPSRQIQSGGLNSKVRQIACSVARTTAQVPDRSSVADLLREAAQHVPVFRLLFVLVGECLGILLGQRVVHLLYSA